MYKIKKISEKDIVDITNLYIELKKENFKINSTIFNKKRTKLKSFDAIKNNILSKYLDKHCGYILTNNNITVGYIFGHEYIDEMQNDIYDLNYKIGVIDNLYFQKEHRGKGYGKKLMEKMDNDFKQNGCEIIELTANICSIGEKFYKKLGFSNAAILLCKDI